MAKDRPHPAFTDGEFPDVRRVHGEDGSVICEFDVKVPEPQTPHFSVELGTLIIPKTSASPNHTLQGVVAHRFFDVTEEGFADFVYDAVSGYHTLGEISSVRYSQIVQTLCSSYGLELSSDEEDLLGGMMTDRLLGDSSGDRDLLDDLNL